jgi:glycine dehydrogenase subunit 1
MDYIQHTEADVKEMLETLGAKSIDDLFDSVPQDVRFKGKLNLPQAHSELELTRELGRLAGANAQAGGEYACFLGGGCYDHYIPALVDHLSGRGEFYTAYTPYQSEASQGTLQTIFEYQTCMCELTGMDISNASHYDGGTAVTEAVIMCTYFVRGRKKVVVSEALHPEYRQIIRTYTAPLGLEIAEIPASAGVTDVKKLKAAVDGDTVCVVVANPNFFGCIEDVETASEAAHGAGALLVACVDPISLALLKPPGACGADIAVGEGQPLGSPMSYGGPHLGFFTAREKYLRKMPGRIVGQTVDADNRRGFVMALQTREQHIRREKATSNICTNHALNAMRALVYLTALGKRGLRKVAELCLQKAHYAAEQLQARGVELAFGAPFFREFAVKCKKPAANVVNELTKKKILAGPALGRFYPEMADCLLVAVTEKNTKEQIDALIEALAEAQ